MPSVSMSPKLGMPILKLFILLPQLVFELINVPRKRIILDGQYLNIMLQFLDLPFILSRLLV